MRAASGRCVARSAPSAPASSRDRGRTRARSRARATQTARSPRAGSAAAPAARARRRPFRGCRRASRGCGRCPSASLLGAFAAPSSGYNAPVAHLFIFGLGYSAKRIRRAAEARGWIVSATGTDAGIRFDDERAVRTALGAATHVLSSVPPGEAGDPVLASYGDALGHRWLGYLSSTGVYGDVGGAWVDESAPTGRGRRTARVEAEA